jgi:hypothetical protein
MAAHVPGPEWGKLRTQIVDMGVQPRLHKLRNLDQVTLGSPSSWRSYGLGNESDPNP